MAAKISIVFGWKTLALDIMPVTLLDLSNNELQIYNQAGYQQKNIGVQLQGKSGEWLFKSYDLIHKEYFKLHERSSDDPIKIEALKRLIFLNWEYFVEDKYYTGIDSLDEPVIFSAFEILNKYIKDNKLDDEFKWMLSFYSSWDFVILKYSEGRLDELTDFVKTADTSGGLLPYSFNNSDMSDRGQMGLQWQSLIKTRKHLKP